MLPLAATADFGRGFLQNLAVNVRLDTSYGAAKKSPKTFYFLLEFKQRVLGE
jgi:hypothetical protein